MRFQRRSVNSALFFVTLGASLALLIGCSQTHGNRAGGLRLVTKAGELRGVAGKQVTLIGTARRSTVGDASVELRGGSVDLPAYAWPEGLIDQPVMVTGTLIGAAGADGRRVFRLGEIEAADRWSR